MKGLLVKISVHARDMPRPIPVDGQPSIELFREHIDGGYLELIPHFNKVLYYGKVHDCLALCDEDGKMKGLRLNKKATTLWNKCLIGQGMPGLWNRGPGKPARDYLVGPVLIVMGDKEFMRML